MRVLIDDSLIDRDGNRCATYIEYADPSEQVAAIASSGDRLALELSYAPIAVPGYRLVEEKTLPDGSVEVTQEFDLAPDVAYALFMHWKEAEKEGDNPPN